MIGIYNYTVLFTLFGTICGITGIELAATGNILEAIICLMLCGFFDMFDGMVARTKKNRSEFEQNYGVQLDSLSDVICFGALPTIISLNITKPLGWWSSLSILYLVTAISRLAYFNVEEEMRRKKEKTARKFYTGIPVTTSSVIIPFLYLFSYILPEHYPVIFLIGILITAFLQVSKLKIPHLEKKGLITCLIFGSLLLLTLFILHFN